MTLERLCIGLRPGGETDVTRARSPATTEKRKLFGHQVAIEEAKSRSPSQVRLGAISKVEDVTAATDYKKFDRPVEFG